MIVEWNEFGLSCYRVKRTWNEKLEVSFMLQRYNMYRGVDSEQVIHPVFLEAKIAALVELQITKSVELLCNIYLFSVYNVERPLCTYILHSQRLLLFKSFLGNDHTSTVTFNGNIQAIQGPNMETFHS